MWYTDGKEKEVLVYRALGQVYRSGIPSKILFQTVILRRENMDAVLSIKLDSEFKARLQKNADNEGISLGEYVRNLLKEHLEGNVRMDLLLQEMQGNIVQLSGMLSIMQAYNTSVYAVLMGRTNPTFKSPEEKKEAVRIRDKAKEDLKFLLSVASKEVVSGENVWGTVKVEENE